VENAAKLWKARFGLEDEVALNSWNRKDFPIDVGTLIKYGESFRPRWKKPQPAGRNADIFVEGVARRLLHVERSAPALGCLFHVELPQDRRGQDR
jgi:hypothetical protein